MWQKWDLGGSPDGEMGRNGRDCSGLLAMCHGCIMVGSCYILFKNSPKLPVSEMLDVGILL